jgi:hypothetical protein
MLYLRIWTDAEGESHIEESAVAFEVREGYALGVPAVGLSEVAVAEGVHFLRLPAGWDGDFHPAPARQHVIQTQGRLEVTASDGVTVVTGPGTVWLVEDTAGKGHRTKVVSADDSIALVVILGQPAVRPG